MSSHIAVVANEPVRAPAQSARRSETVDNSGDSDIVTVTPSSNKAKEATDATFKQAEVNTPELEVAVEVVQTVVSDLKRELRFSVDEDSGRTIITVIDRESGKIIRQIPPEELLQIADRVAEGGNVNLIQRRV